MSDNEFFKDYGWKELKNPSYNYLLLDIEKILGQMMIPKEAVILDAGCGTGYIACQVYERGYKNIWGFDASPSGINIAKSHIHLKDRVRVHDAYQRKLPSSFPEHGYDIVLSIEVIEHMYHPKRYLENIKFWLKKDGILIITTPYHGYIKNLVTSLLNKFDRHFDPLWEGGHIKFFSKKTLCRLLEDLRIGPIRCYGSGRLPFIWKSMIIVGKND